MPLAFDQPDNAARLRRLKVGRWILPGKFRADRVAAALTDLLGSGETAEACRDLARRIASQDALAKTCDLLEGIAPSMASL
jgi:UDP:flavonoid glycosyltransferase YjiC (YdhE family)